MERRLAAIIAADVVGYSRLMGADEIGTLSALNKHRKGLIEPKARQYNGRTVKLMGDGALMEFASAVDAVAFATEVQCAMRERNEGVPNNRQIVYRVGINIGDIIIEGDDIFGDGVNIAARLESLAKPGGICLAGNVFDQVKGKLDLTYEHVGEKKVKNITEPVPVYQLVLDDKAGRITTEILADDSIRTRRYRNAATGLALLLVVAVVIWWKPWVPAVVPAPSVPKEQASLPLPDRPSIAVLPFTNMSDDKAQEYFSDGITEDLITDLSKISGLFVIARNSSFTYKGRAVNSKQVGHELGVRYVLEGSVRNAAGQIRITAQLIDATTGGNVWAERYDRELKDIFDLQDDVREKIISALAVKLTPSQKERFLRRDRIGVEAYDLLLRGVEQEGYFTKSANLASRTFFQKVIDLEPDFAEAHARLANSYDIASTMGWSEEDPDDDIRLALAAAQRAATLDLSLPYAHWTLGRVYTHMHRHKDAIESMKRAIDLAPNYADAHAYLGLVFNYTGDAGIGLDAIDKALALNPKAPFWYFYVRGLSLYLLKRYKDAIPVLVRSIEANPNVPWSRHVLIAVYGHLGDIDNAEWQQEELAVQGNNLTISTAPKVNSIQDGRYLARYLGDLRKAGVPE